MNTHLGTTTKRIGSKLFPSLLVFIWPILYFYDRFFYVNDHFTGIGNDFGHLYFVYKQYILDQISHGHIPLWSPSEAAGYPLYSSPFVQFFYPFNLILLKIYINTGGLTQNDYQKFTILGVSIFALGLFYWLKQIKLSPRSALLATLIMSISYRMAEIQRFPNAVHTAAWYPWILFLVTKIVSNKELKSQIRYGLLLSFVGICFLTGGYPYYIYYFQFLIGPYLALLFIPKTRKILFKVDSILPKQSLGVLFFSGLIPIILCSPYLYKMSQLLDQTVGRDGKDISFSAWSAFSFKDIIGSLVFPPVASFEGFYYFGFIGLFMILGFIFGIWNIEEKSREVRQYNVFAKCVLLTWFIFISYMTMGLDSYLFKILWNYWPKFSSPRVWARANILLIPLIGWLIAISYSEFESWLLSLVRSVEKKLFIKKATPVLIFVIFVSLIIGAIQLYFLKDHSYYPYWSLFFSNIVNRDQFFVRYMALAASIILALVCLAPVFRKKSPQLLYVFCFLVFVSYSVVDMVSVGKEIHMYPPFSFTRPDRIPINVDIQNINSFKERRTWQRGTVSGNNQFFVGVVESWNFKRYDQFLGEFFGPMKLGAKDVYPVERVLPLNPEKTKIIEKLLGITDGQKIFLSHKIDLPIQDYLKDAESFPGSYQIVSYNGDVLKLKVDSQDAGYVGFIDNWDPDWEAKLDGRPTSIKLLFKTFKSVEIPIGQHEVEFRYVPHFFSQLKKNAQPLQLD